jgi:hypothetical protein
MNLAGAIFLSLWGHCGPPEYESNYAINLSFAKKNRRENSNRKKPQQISDTAGSGGITKNVDVNKLRIIPVIKAASRDRPARIELLESDTI